MLIQNRHSTHRTQMEDGQSQRVESPICAKHRRQQKLEVHSYRIEGTCTMRLFLAAVMVVAAFVLAALLVSRLFPYGAGGAGLCVAVTCLYASAFCVWVLFGNKPDKHVGAVQSKITRRHLLRDNLLYFAVANGGGHNDCRCADKRHRKRDTSQL